MKLHYPPFSILSVLLGALLLIGCSEELPPYHQRVDPLIGTGGHGHTYPGATSPFGMVQLSPDTRLTGWDGCGGYHYSDSTIYGFSHTHLQGTGVSDYGDILFAPCTQFRSGAANWSERYSSRFSHASEEAEAGFYSVHLADQNLRADLTTTPRVGIHRYRLDEPDTLTLIVDMQHRDNLIHYSIYPLNDSTLVGHRVSDNWAREQHVYFAARFDRPFEWRDQLTEVNNVGYSPEGDLLQEVEYVPVFAADYGGDNIRWDHLATAGEDGRLCLWSCGARNHCENTPSHAYPPASSGESGLSHSVFRKPGGRGGRTSGRGSSLGADRFSPY